MVSNNFKVIHKSANAINIYNVVVQNSYSNLDLPYTKCKIKNRNINNTEEKCPSLEIRFNPIF